MLILGSKIYRNWTYLSETMLIGRSSKRSHLYLEANCPQYYQVNSSLPATRSSCWPWNPEICLEDAIATLRNDWQRREAKIFGRASHNTVHNEGCFEREDACDWDRFNWVASKAHRRAGERSTIIAIDSSSRDRSYRSSWPGRVFPCNHGAT